MLIKDALVRDPSVPLANQGQARISTVEDERTLGELRFELSTFVCEGAFQTALVQMLNAFVQNVGRSNVAQKAAWVSGFFGTGKSHLLKMACHLWANTALGDGSTARGVVQSLPSDVADALAELDNAARRSGGTFTAAGTLLGGSMDSPRLTILAIILAAAGIPDQVPQARLRFWMEDEGILDAVRPSIEAAGSNLITELKNMHVSRRLSQAILDAMPGFAPNEAEVRHALRAQFPAQTGDIDTRTFVELVRRALLSKSTNGKLPCTLVVLDEVQQYISNSSERSSNVTEAVEALQKEFDGHVMVVGAGQNALTDTPMLQYLKDRMTILADLKDADVETVTRKVLLRKKPSAEGQVAGILDRHRGEISRQLSGTRIGERAADQNVIVADYPLLPVRRRFWEECFRQVDKAGTSGQLRSQLRIISDALAHLADQDIGKVIPADELYDALAPDMLANGALLHEMDERIVAVATDVGPLASRVCKVVFLIGKFRREGAADVGIRSKKEHVADLLVDDLAADNGKLRDEVAKALSELADAGVLMPVGDEFRLQTREGAEWDSDFRARVGKIRADEALIQSELSDALRAKFESEVRKVNLTHGQARVPRRMAIYWQDTIPTETGTNVPIWVRDGWSGSKNEMEAQARRAGLESAMIFAFIPKQFAEDIRRAIVDEIAARKTLEAHGHPEAEEGKEARRGIESREAKAKEAKTKIISELVGNAVVYQGGADERQEETLVGKIDAAGRASLTRLFGRFSDADSAHWDKVIARVREGSDTPFEPVGHRDAPEKHPVGREVLNAVGAGATGTDIRRKLQDVGFGWPQDAIDAALLALHRSQHISAMLNGSPVQIGTLDQAKIAKAAFKREVTILSATDKIRLRTLFSKLGVTCKSNEEAVKAPAFLDQLVELGRSAGGPAPLPEPPNLAAIEEMRRLAGTEQLGAILAKADEIERQIGDWRAKEDLAEQRRPAWALVEGLARHAEAMSPAPAELAEIDSIRSARSLLADTDPAGAVLSGLVTALRGEASRLHGTYQQAVATGRDQVAEHPLWSETPGPKQDELLRKHSLHSVEPLRVGDKHELLATLDAMPLRQLADRPLMVPGRVQAALRDLATLHKPEVRFVRVEPGLLQNGDDLENWLDRQRETIEAALARGPVQVGS